MVRTQLLENIINKLTIFKKAYNYVNLMENHIFQGGPTRKNVFILIRTTQDNDYNIITNDINSYWQD